MNMPMEWVKTPPNRTWPPSINEFIKIPQELSRLLKSTFDAKSWHNPSKRGMHFVTSKIEKCCSKMHKINDLRWMHSAFNDYLLYFYDLFKNDVIKIFEKLILSIAKNRAFHQKYEELIQLNNQKLIVGFTKTHKGIFVYSLTPIK